MKKVFPVIVFAFLCSSFFSQTEKIKIKKEETTCAKMENVCPMKVIIASDLEGQAMKINSYTINDHPSEQEIANSKEYAGTFQFLDKEITVNRENIKGIFDRACSVNGFVLLT